MTNGNSVHLDFHSTYEMLDFVQVASDHLGRLAGLDDEALHWVGVAVRESVIKRHQAWQQGATEHKHVHVEFTAARRGPPSAASFACAMRDLGFDLNGLADPLAPENCLEVEWRAASS
jgi:hypothetical protein